METRMLGKTGLELSIIGFGGFHLIEVAQKEVEYLLNGYLDKGGNYIESAAQYADGLSERKIGQAVSSRRDDFLLATKTMSRTSKGALASLEQSLRNLRTDYVDIFFMHQPQTVNEAKQILAPGGALEAGEKAKMAGKIRFIGVTGHGKPYGLLYSLKNHDFDVLMTGFNYFDRFNFPAVEDELLPLCLEKRTGVLAMKALADGYLAGNTELAIRYALSLRITSIVLGINSKAYLEQDLEIADSWNPMSEAEKEHLYRTAPELGTYVCRLCGKCRDGSGFEPWQVFLLEGLYDRQMNSYEVPDPAQYALQERLKHWFNQADWAVKEYAQLDHRVDPKRDYSELNALCPYSIDIERKLRIAHAKLTAKDSVWY